MIELYTGTPGSGKSLHCAEMIKKWVSIWKAPVIGNFGFKAAACNEKGWGSYLEVSNDQLSPDFLIYFSEKYKSLRGWLSVPEEHILLVIDEAQLLFNSREWMKASRKGWISFFTQHRKLGYRIVMVCQYDQMIDKQVRALVEYEHIHRKVKNIGKGGFLLSTITGGGLHIDVTMYKPLNTKTGSTFFKADPTLYALYDSYSRFEEQKIEGSASE